MEYKNDKHLRKLSGQDRHESQYYEQTYMWNE